MAEEGVTMVGQGGLISGRSLGHLLPGDLLRPGELATASLIKKAAVKREGHGYKGADMGLNPSWSPLDKLASLSLDFLNHI